MSTAVPALGAGLKLGFLSTSFKPKEDAIMRLPKPEHNRQKPTNSSSIPKYRVETDATTNALANPEEPLFPRHVCPIVAIQQIEL